MYEKRFDTFEDDAEVTRMIDKLQSEGIKYLSIPDEFWNKEFHSGAVATARDMGKKVMATL